MVTNVNIVWKDTMGMQQKALHLIALEVTSKFLILSI